MSKIITKKELKRMILEITAIEYRFMSIREITTKLQEKYGIKKSPQAIKNILEELEREGELQKE